MKTWESFQNIWVVDFEFFVKNGNRPLPLCYIAHNVKTGETIRHWINPSDKTPLYSTDGQSLFIAYFSSAEMSCHKVMNFKTPPNIVDLFCEFRNQTNGLTLPSGRGLLGACTCYGISSGDAVYKKSMRTRILQGPPYNKSEQQKILDYCEKDVELTTKLFQAMKPDIELSSAILRGRFMDSIAHMEHNGIPIDIESLKELQDCWEIIKEEIICRVDQKYNCFEGTVFKTAKFEEYLQTHNIPWECTVTGAPKTDNQYMHEQAKLHPELKELQELRYSLGQLKLKAIQIGDDGRNRCLLSPFSTITSRNAPSTSKFIFGNAKWLRHLIKPTEGKAISYIDYEQQELAITGVLSGDKNLLSAYKSGDPYLAFAKSTGAIPPDGTKETHSETRELYKRCMLALNYGMGAQKFADSVKIPVDEAKLMLKKHKREYGTYWKWITAFIDAGKLTGSVETKYHWRYDTRNAKYSSLLNWPAQSHGAEILRLGICLCVDKGIQVLCPVHDAILVESDIDKIEETVALTQKCMEDASEYVLDFRIRTEAKTVRYPDRYIDKAGVAMWDNIKEVIQNLNPNEIEERLKEKAMKKAVPLDLWKADKPKLKGNYSKMRRSQLMLKPQNFSEKQLAQRLRKKTGWSHISIMHLIREARETDFDIEHEIDWKNMNYETAKEKICQKKKMKDILGGV